MKSPSLSRISVSALSLVALSTLVGCGTKTYTFEHGASTGSLGSNHPLHGRYIYVDLSGVPETYDDKVEVNSYHFDGIRAHVNMMMHRMFDQEKLVAAEKDAQVVLRAQLTLDLGSAFGGTKCTGKATWQVSGAAGQAVGQGEGESKIAATNNGGRNCEIATTEAIAQGLDAAFAQL